jgi:5-methylcytosine-specific restriction endonuclease McrA
MSQVKQAVRDHFRSSVFKRDKDTCKVCGDRKGPMDAHHIIDRHLMPEGGYVKENGITLCPICHEKAEEELKKFLAQQPDIKTKYSPLTLFSLIKSSYEKAVTASEKDL